GRSVPGRGRRAHLRGDAARSDGAGDLPPRGPRIAQHPDRLVAARSRRRRSGSPPGVPDHPAACAALPAGSPPRRLAARDAPPALSARDDGRDRALPETLRLGAPPWEPDPPYHLPDGPRTVLERLKAEDLSAAPGVLHGLTYPLAPDLEGMHTLLFKPMLDGLPALQWEE